MSGPSRISLDLSLAASTTAARRRQRDEIRARVNVEEDTSNSQSGSAGRQAVASVTASGVQLAAGEQSRKRRLVIPLHQNTSNDSTTSDESSSASQQQDAPAPSGPSDEDAAAALIADLEGAAANQAAPRVTHIQMEAASNSSTSEGAGSSSAAQKSVLKGDATLKSQLFAHPSRAVHGTNAGSLLMRARQSRADDMASLPDAPSFHSSTYDNVPIDEFGAAVLRGMGATEEQLEGVQGNEPHKLNTYRGGRGLGAGANPLQELDAAFKHEGRARPDGSTAAPTPDQVMSKLRTGQYEAETAAAQAAASRAEAAKAASKAATPGRYEDLSVGCVVQVNRRNHPAHGALGAIVKSEGVPGLDAVELRVALHALPSLARAGLTERSTWHDISAALDQHDKALKRYVVPEPEVCVSLISASCRAAASHSPVAGGLDLLKEQMGALVPKHAAGTLVLRVSKAYCERRAASSMTDEQHSQAGAAVVAQHAVAQAVQEQSSAFVQRLGDIVTNILKEKGTVLTQKRSAAAAAAADASSSSAKSAAPAAAGQGGSSSAAQRPSHAPAAETAAGSSAIPQGRPRGWLRPGIRVRIVDRRHRYYKHKAEVLDVTQPRVAVLRVENERRSRLEDMHERDLETVIPRESGARVMILSGSYAGFTARVLSRDSKGQTAELHIDEDGCNRQYSFDDICALA